MIKKSLIEYGFFFAQKFSYVKQFFKTIFAMGEKLFYLTKSFLRQSVFLEFFCFVNPRLQEGGTQPGPRIFQV